MIEWFTLLSFIVRLFNCTPPFESWPIYLNITFYCLAFWSTDCTFKYRSLILTKLKPENDMLLEKVKVEFKAFIIKLTSFTFGNTITFYETLIALDILFLNSNRLNWLIYWFYLRLITNSTVEYFSSFTLFWRVEFFIDWSNEFHIAFDIDSNEYWFCEVKSNLNWIQHFWLQS
jgi:hypothetical protein